MTDLWRDAEALYQELFRGDVCECARIDFTNWPSDLAKKCGHCREVDLIEAFAKAQRQQEVEAIAKEFHAGGWTRMISFEDVSNWLTQRAKELE